MGSILVRRAVQGDLDALLSLYEELADTRTTAMPVAGSDSEPVLAEILADARRELSVAVLDDQVVGTADLLIVPNLTHRAEPWAIIENVVVGGAAQRKGVGRALVGHLIDLARAAGCCKVQLLSGKHRTEAHAFYRSLGFEPVAEGFKIYFDV